MSPKQRVEAVLRGQIPDRVPVCLHNFLPAAREAGLPLERTLHDPFCAAESHIRAIEKYGHDCILVDFDTTLLAEAMGARRDSTPDSPGHIASPAINDLSEVDNLRIVDPLRDGRIPALLETIRILDRELGNHVSIRANADQCAFSLAGLLRGMEEFLMDLMEEDQHENAHRLLEVSYQSHLALHRALAEAGAHFTSLGDSSSGPDVVSPSIYTQFARPYQERLVRELAASKIFVVIHICGNTSLLLDQFAEFPRCGFELDSKTNAAEAKAIVGASHLLTGNINPGGVIARGTPEGVRTACRELMELWKPGANFILNSGCAIPASTPPENISALVRAAREFGTY